MAVGLGLAVPHVRVASGTRAVSEGPGWLHVHALSCAGGLPVRAVQREQWRALGPAAGSASLAVTVLDSGTEAPTAALAGASPVHGGVTGVVARAAGVGGGANGGALGSDSCGASAVLVMAVGFRGSESLWATAKKATGGSCWLLGQGWR